MNICEPFIRRPIATTLLTVAIALAGAVAFTCFPFRRCRKSISRRSRSTPACRARVRGDHGVVGGDAARAPVRAHRLGYRDDLVERPGIHQHHAAIRS